MDHMDCIHLQSSIELNTSDVGGFNFERNCVLGRWESDSLQKIINRKVDKVH